VIVELGLGGKVAMVAGGSSGLGLAAAKELAKEGAHVVIGARDPDRLATAERTLKEVATGRVATTRVDITDADAAQRWVDETREEFGALHIVVVSGAGPAMGKASEFALADYKSAVESVLYPPIALSLAALPHLRAAGFGRLLFVTSETASVPVATLALSGVARAGIVRFAQALAADVAPDGITVNVLAPGPTHTEMVDRAATRLGGPDGAAAVLEALGKDNAIGRIARPEEFGAVAAFLASERASFVTGLVHLIDGGASAKGHEGALYAGAGKDTFA
jgi:3-oxoacyl-[acyl-carrier protein] reductase